MFEVITSEASYYRSLQVLINHFYGAPEFDCSRATQQGSATDGETEASSLDSGTPSSSSSFSVNASANSGSSEINKTNSKETGTTSIRGMRAGSVTADSQPVSSIKPVLSPTEKHHLFSNVLLVCMASEGLVNLLFGFLLYGWPKLMDSYKL